MNETRVPVWETKRTDETRGVEKLLKDAGFERVDSYRYNSASIRLRVVDPRFEGIADDERDAMVEAHLERLPERTQGDIMSILTFTPSEMAQMDWLSKGFIMNAEFDDPSPSML